MRCITCRNSIKFLYISRLTKQSRVIPLANVKGRTCFPTSNFVPDMRYLQIFLSVAICTCTWAQVLEVQPINSSPTAAPLGCHRRLYTYRVTQADPKGRECWDYVSVAACWGRCDSSEISDWKFPYKRSFHPVCVHATRQPAVAVLRNCHPEADEIARRYEYLEAVSCHCHTCSTMDTSCEAPANNILDEKSGVKVLALTGSDSDGLDY